VLIHGAVGYLKAKDYATVYTDIKAVVDACAGVPVKVILETCLLSADEIIASSVIAYEVLHVSSSIPSRRSSCNIRQVQRS
jgi:deoxyribose-phosphate aldolase